LGNLTLAEAWNGTSWTVQTTANPSGSGYNSLAAVSCPTAAMCTAVGTYNNGSTAVTLAEAWNGTSWSFQSTQNPSGAIASALYGVSCPVTTACSAVGDWNYFNYTLAEQWS
jgi:hypothetical protein